MLDITGPLLDASKHLRGGRRYKLLSPNELDILTTFYHALSADDRRCRFGGTLSDTAVREYCEGILWTNTSVIVRSGPYCIEAAATIAQIDDHRVEIALAWPSLVKSGMIVPPLLLLALTAARSLYRASEAIIDLDLAHPCLLQCAKETGHLTINQDLATVDLQALASTEWLEAS